MKGKEFLYELFLRKWIPSSHKQSSIKSTKMDNNVLKRLIACSQWERGSFSYYRDDGPDNQSRRILEPIQLYFKNCSEMLCNQQTYRRTRTQ